MGSSVAHGLGGALRQLELRSIQRWDQERRRGPSIIEDGGRERTEVQRCVWYGAYPSRLNTQLTHDLC
jgi:hypothetical protein